jgi:hypothetical protein
MTDETNSPHDHSAPYPFVYRLLFAVFVAIVFAADVTTFISSGAPIGASQLFAVVLTALAFNAVAQSLVCAQIGNTAGALAGAILAISGTAAVIAISVITITGSGH